MRAARLRWSAVSGRKPTPAVLGLLTVLAIAMLVLFVRALLTSAFSGALFLLGFAALFTWQIGGFVKRNRPRSYSFDDLPKELLP